jgi:UrcA family protein
LAILLLEGDADGVAWTRESGMSRFIARISTVAMLPLAALPALSLAHGAQAAPAQMAVLARIPIGDLDLSRPDHARLLKVRIETTRTNVCDARIQAENLDRWSARACRRDVDDEVRSKLSATQARALRGVGG